MAAKRSRSKTVYFIMDHKRRVLYLVAGATKTAAIRTYLTESCRLVGQALAKELCLRDDINFFDIQPVSVLATKAKYKPQRLVSW